MEFQILGSLEVRDRGRSVAIRGGKARALLALLLVNANRTLSVDRLVDDLWGEQAPESAPKMVQIFVSQLRKVLPGEILRTRPPGYLLEVEPEQLDLGRFERLVGDGRAALSRGEPERAAEQLAEGLALWKGTALAEFASEPFAGPEGARLEELRVAALEDRIDADLACGRGADLVGELELLVARHPLRERFRGQQMLALYRAGRQADALASYQQARRTLAEELGLEPSSALRELQRRILEQDPLLDVASAPAAGYERPATPVLDQQPAARAAAEPRVAHTTCTVCGATAPAGARFCPSCGAVLPGGEASEEMLKLVTVLFADVVGSTAHAESRHPEDVRAVMQDYFAALAEVIRTEGGTIEKFVGDAIMAVFGVPVAHEDDALRAVRAARRMLDRLDAWNDAREPAQRLEVRIGISTGEVLAADGPRADLLVTGETVNVAARLQQAAEPGTIVVGERTARAVRSHFDVRPGERPLALKGKSEPVPVWHVGIERPEVEPRLMTGLNAPLVGRDHELATLQATLARVLREKRPELVTLVGDAGIGKSRLVGEFLASMDVETHVLVGRCLPVGEGATLSPLAEMLKAEAAVLDSDSAEIALSKLSTLLTSTVSADLLADRDRTLAALASTLGLRLPEDPLAALHPQEVYRELVTAWRALLASFARRTPVVAVVEDLHWADPTMLDVLDELAERLEGHVLFVCTARPDLLRVRPEWGGGRRAFSSLPLDPLAVDESVELASFLLELEAFPVAARRRILERSAGNPFFLEEIVRHMIDEGRLVRQNGRWGASDNGVGEIEIPDSVHGVILARLDLLSPEERRVVQRAAVVGRVFWPRAVAALARVPDLEARLQTLRRREFVVERVSSTLAGETEYTFKHVLIRDVAYESLPRRERGRAHAELAAWIEETLAERMDEFVEVLAHHYDAAFSYLGTNDLRRKARAQLLAAATSAHRRFAIEHGERFARRAVELADSSEERLEALETLGDLHYMAGDAAWRAYTDAMAEVSETDPAFARLAGKAAVFAVRWVGTMQDLPEVDEVRRIIDTGLLAAAPRTRERAQLLVTRGFLLVQREARDDPEANAAVAEALTACEELGDPDLLSAVLDLVQAQHMHFGRYGEMYRTALRRNGLVPRLKDAREVSDSHAMTAWSAQHLGRYREAEVAATAGIERARGLDAGGYLHGLTWRVAAHFMLGDWDAALADQDEIERVTAQDARDLPPPFTMRAHTHSALCHVLRGEDERADAYIELSLRYSRLRSAQYQRSIHLAPLGLALARRGRVDEALAVIPFMPHRENSGLTLEVLCEVTAVRGVWEETPGIAAAARDEAAHGESLSLRPYLDRLEGRTALAAGDVHQAGIQLERSADGFAKLGAIWEEAWSRLLLAEALAGDDAERAETELAVALPVFDRLRSVREADRARALLASAGV